MCGSNCKQNIPYLARPVTTVMNFLNFLLVVRIVILLSSPFNDIYFPTLLISLLCSGFQFIFNKWLNQNLPLILHFAFVSSTLQFISNIFQNINTIRFQIRMKEMHLCMYVTLLRCEWYFFSRLFRFGISSCCSGGICSSRIFLFLFNCSIISR